MSFKNLGNNQTIVLHNCEIDNKKYDLVITPHTQTVGYIRTKRQTLKRKIITKQRQITRKRFSKNRNAFSESEASNLDELFKLKESIDKNCPIYDQLIEGSGFLKSNSWMFYFQSFFAKLREFENFPFGDRSYSF